MLENERINLFKEVVSILHGIIIGFLIGSAILYWIK